MECGSRNESVSLSNVKHCLDWTLDENIMTVANLFVEGKMKSKGSIGWQKKQDD